MSIGSGNIYEWRLSVQVPPTFLLETDPWTDIDDGPHETIASPCRLMPIRYVKAHPMPELAPEGAC